MGRMQGRDVAFIGGGIGGLAAALAFARRGANVTVYEQAPELREVGAGLQISPNGGRVLEALGLDAAAASIPATAVEPMDALTGRRITRFDLTRLDGPPYRFFYRPDLIDLLAGGCAEAGVALRTGVKIDLRGGRPHLNDGTPIRADLVVGADGIHSVIRPELNGKDAAFFAGQVAWRATIRAKDAAPVARTWMAPGCHVVTYPLLGGRLNIVAVQERADWAAEGWHFFDDPSVVQAAFAHCAPELRAILSEIQTVRLWGLFRHPVAPVWQDGQGTAILGDAAHPTLPFMAQGATLALEDAWVLAAACDELDDLPSGLARYQALRRDRACRAIAAANANAVNFHLSGLRRSLSHRILAGIGRVAPGAFLGRYDWLYRHDVTAPGYASQSDR
ncbi:FAD-binding protein [Loktanella sp. IMCC34160]|uniref:FAD-dependent monooxygenase n=1 Tax=Loktanella sp. IMCC34160 TaxID=2510646 RepID=UPI00101CC2A6|nr:FAD-dependent monooxygenase [Loktanella sp. IMCC34160]RYG92325.1 FAD-binding protein [Loktanella sp. IMCC34160]